MQFHAHIRSDGRSSREPVAARRISHYVGAVRYWFALHPLPGGSELAVSEWESGDRLVTIPDSGLRVENATAARAAVDRLAARIGSDKMKAAIAAAVADHGLAVVSPGQPVAVPASAYTQQQHVAAHT